MDGLWMPESKNKFEYMLRERRRKGTRFARRFYVGPEGPTHKEKTNLQIRHKGTRESMRASSSGSDSTSPPLKSKGGAPLPVIYLRVARGRPARLL